MGEREGAVADMVDSAKPNPLFWQDKRVLLTGHTGFKGAWMALWLTQMGAKVTGIALAPTTDLNLFELARIGQAIEVSYIQDIRDADAIREIATDARPDIVMHLAAQPLVLDSYKDPLGTFATNVQGTANVLDAVREVGSARVVVAVTTDKVYRNLEESLPFRESDPLGGHDPYSASKAASEIIIASYRDSFLSEKGVRVASARAGNVIGGGDWSANRLIPDAVKAWGNGNSLEVRRPDAVRPWQHVLEPVAGYLRLAEKLWHDPQFVGAYNFGPHTHEAATVRDVLTIAREAYGRGDCVWGDGSAGVHEAGWLALETAKARQTLGVVSRWSLEAGVARTMAWYRRLSDGNAAALCYEDIEAFNQTFCPMEPRDEI